MKTTRSWDSLVETSRNPKGSILPGALADSARIYSLEWSRNWPSVVLALEEVCCPLKYTWDGIVYKDLPSRLFLQGFKSFPQVDHTSGFSVVVTYKTKMPGTLCHCDHRSNWLFTMNIAPLSRLITFLHFFSKDFSKRIWLIGAAWPE